MNAGLSSACRAVTRHLAWSITAAALLACSATGSKPSAAADTAVAAQSSPKSATAASTMPQIKPGPVSIKESFVARREATAQLRGLALVQNPIGPHWVYTADASTDELVIFDAPTGRFNRKFGKHGTQDGEFSGITDIASVDRLLLVAEAGNRRVQLLYLTALHTLGSIGPDLVKSPVAVDGRTLGGGRFMVYVVDREADQLVLRLIEVDIQAAASPPGTDPIFSLDMKTVVLNSKKVLDVPLGFAADADASLQLDRANDRLLLSSGKTLKSFKLDGSARDADLTPPSIVGELHGLGLFACPADNDKGYWILGDRTADAQWFQVIDRVTMEPVTRFGGLQIKDSGALLFVQEAMAYFPFGAVYALNQGTSVGALNWQQLAVETGVRRICL